MTEKEYLLEMLCCLPKVLLERRIKDIIEPQDYWLNNIEVEVVEEALLLYDEPKYIEIRMREDCLKTGIANDIMVAKPTGDVVQDDETPGYFCPAKNQLYFLLRDKNHEFMLGLREMLECIAFAEAQGEIPKLGDEWWTPVRTRYELWPEQE